MKDWILIGFSWSVIKDKVTLINLLGYLLAFAGVAWYNNAKLQVHYSSQAFFCLLCRFAQKQKCFFSHSQEMKKEAEMKNTPEKEEMKSLVSNVEGGEVGSDAGKGAK